MNIHDLLLSVGESSLTSAQGPHVVPERSDERTQERDQRFDINVL